MDRSYLFKHWLTTLIFSPFLPTVYDLLFNPVEGESLGLLDLYPIILIFSFVLSIPTLIVYYFVFSFLIMRQANPVSTKLILITVAIIGIAITFLTIGGSMEMTLISSFSLSTIITGVLIRIKSKTDSIKNINAVLNPGQLINPK